MRQQKENPDLEPQCKICRHGQAEEYGMLFDDDIFLLLTAPQAHAP